MSSLLIPCPKCGKELKLRDRKLLGRRGRCPKCQHSFVLNEPEEVELELADTAAASSSDTSAAVGTAAQWVPDNAPAPQSPPIDSAQPETIDPLAAINTADDVGGVGRLKELRRKNAKRRNAAIMIGVVTALLIGGGAYFAMPYLATDSEEVTVDDGDDRDVVEAIDQPPAVADVDPVETAKPIELLCIPAGARVIIHIRPADLWKEGGIEEEFRFCLPSLGEWIETQLKEVCHREPAQIESALICLILGPRGTAPQVAATVRLVEPAKKSELLLEFQGMRNEDFGYPVYVGDEYAYLLKDTQTFAIAPKEFAGQMVDSMSVPALTTDGIEKLLLQTDQNRHFTLLFEPVDLRTHHEALFPQELWPFTNNLVDWINDDDVETVAWSLHLGKQLESQFLFRNKGVIRPSRLQKQLVTSLNQLPHDLLEAVQKMNPRQVGSRKLIGRFPAMMKVFSLATKGSYGERHAKLTTKLKSDRAAPNLALGALLTWDESTRTDFSKEVIVAKAKPKLPDKIADRLKLPVDIDFRGTPLQECIAYIGEEIQVKFKIDGDGGFKDAGWTQNMRQTHNLGTVPAIQGIHAIVSQYDDIKQGKLANAMVMIVDEQNKIVLLTSKKFADRDGLKAFPTAP